MPRSPPSGRSAFLAAGQGAADIEQGVEGRLRAHVEALFPICRSITGPGLRDTLCYIAGQVPLQMHEVPSGTPVLDWEIPKEWIVRGATIRSLDGHKAIDFADNNLHLLQYSVPIDRVVSRSELDRHLHSLPGQPDFDSVWSRLLCRHLGFLSVAQRPAGDDRCRLPRDHRHEPDRRQPVLW